jgi:hypothetical protein
MVIKVFENLRPGGWIEYQHSFPVVNLADGSAPSKFLIPITPAVVRIFVLPVFRFEGGYSLRRLNMNILTLLRKLMTDPAMKRFCDLCIKGTAAKGRDITMAKQYKAWLIESGCMSHTACFG